MYRIPLIEPLDIISPTGIGGYWQLDLPYKQIETVTGSVGVASVNIIDSIIVLRSHINLAKESYSGSTWLIIDTKNKTEIAQRNIDKYEKTLRS